MNMAAVDWAILLGVLFCLMSGVLITRKYMQSVADFLAAGRTAGRYILSLSQGIAGLGAISIVGMLEMCVQKNETWNESTTKTFRLWPSPSTLRTCDAPSPSLIPPEPNNTLN